MMRVWNGLIRLRVGSSGEPLWMVFKDSASSRCGKFMK